MEGQRKSRTARARSVRASSSRLRAAMKSLDRSVILSPCCPKQGLLSFRFIDAEVLVLRAGMIDERLRRWKALCRETDVRKYSYCRRRQHYAAFCDRKSPRAL